MSIGAVSMMAMVLSIGLQAYTLASIVFGIIGGTTGIIYVIGDLLEVSWKI